LGTIKIQRECILNDALPLFEGVSVIISS